MKKIKRPCQCGEDRRNAISPKGVCACCAACPNVQRMAKCPLCGRENAPFDRHHLFGRRAQEVLGNKTFTFAICKNCHSVLSTFLLPFMNVQRKFLIEENTPENRANALVLAELTFIAQAAEFHAHEYHLAKDLRDTMRRMNKYGIG